MQTFVWRESKVTHGNCLLFLAVVSTAHKLCVCVYACVHVLVHVCVCVCVHMLVCSVCAYADSEVVIIIT